MKQNTHKGFTLIEILVTVALIGVLLGIIIVTVDPVEQFGNTRNQRRIADATAIALAVERYVADAGSLPGGVTEVDKAICRASCLTDETQVSLTVLQPFIGDGILPIDPSQEDDELTGYLIRSTGVGRVYVSAPNAENGETIGFGDLEVTGAGFSVTDLPGLRLWLKADEGISPDSSGNVGLWADQSGNRLEALQPLEDSRPAFVNNALNSLPVVRFDGVDDFLSGDGLDLRGEDDLTLIFVTNAQSDLDPDSIWYGGAHSQLFFEETDQHGKVYLSIQQNKVNWHVGTGTWQNPPPSYTRPSSIGTNFTFTMLIHDGSTEDLYVDGTTSVFQYTDNNEFIGGNRDAYTIGRTRFSTIAHAHSDIAEVIILTEALNPTQRLEVYNYISTKYAL